MNKLTNWIKKHQVAAFFVITFAITWGLGFSYGAVMNRWMAAREQSSWRTTTENLG